jgi:hypothetical protein
MHRPARLIPLAIPLALLLLMVLSICANAQAPPATNTTSTPAAGAHDYLQSGVETVNPANGDRRHNPVTSFHPEFRSSNVLPTSGHYGPAAASTNCSILRTIRTFFAPSLQRPPQCFQHNTGSFFGIFHRQSFVLNNIQPLFCKTGG